MKRPLIHLVLFVSLLANLRALLLGRSRRPLRQRRAFPSPDAQPTTTDPLQATIGNMKPIVIANREPYIHRKRDATIEVVRPASGLVTALEPVLRSSGGLWIAHGDGSADRETCNWRGELRVPPGQPRYTLKRVWLTPEEEKGYYLGFSNEGLWPLCHRVHARPIFRDSDWLAYQRVNRKFADAVPKADLNGDSGILVQDYHFALLPRMLRARRGDQARSRIGLFWHIPWPSADAFSICPWGRELLLGMLGADVLGFHTRQDCHHFLETCERELEARVDWEDSMVTREGHSTRVEAFPIGIDTAPVPALTEREIQELKRRYGITAEHVAVGVDRIDYTKGIIERIDAVERFLDRYPRYVGRFTFAQMGSPSRTDIPAYRDLMVQVEGRAAEVNRRFGSGSYQPVVLLTSHHEWDEIRNFYQIGDLCIVTSLHDGMNLVSKEYVWCQAAHRGSLILSRFAGASRELTDAFLVNPYHSGEIAEAIRAALELPPEERMSRMVRMKARVRENNAHEWARSLVAALTAGSPRAAADLTRLESPGPRVIPRIHAS